MTRVLTLLLATLALTACGGVFESKLVAPQAYVLRLPPSTPPEVTPSAGSILVQRPEAGPGLDSDRIVLLRSDQRFDVYAASRWAAPAPDLLESVMLDALRATGSFSAVFDDAAAFAPVYNLRCMMRRFESDYTSERGGAGGRGPTVHVALDCTLGRRRDRELLAVFSAQGSKVAEDDRLSAVVAAFESATSAAMQELGRAATDAVAREKKPSEGR
jgi:ABC-type uncharacterized transport system auxiliary subunit